MDKHLTRREFTLASIAALALASCPLKMSICSPQQNYAPPTPILPPLDLKEDGRRLIDKDLSALVEFADKYRRQHLTNQEDAKIVNILYPGSAFDMSSLEIGLQLLYHSPLEQVKIVHTELGNIDSFEDIGGWHEGLIHLDGMIQSGLESLVEKGHIKTVKRQVKEDSPWKRQDVPSSAVIEYELSVPVGTKIKKLTFTLAHNTFEDRYEPTAKELAVYSPKLVADARGGYWPKETKPEERYPTYFSQAQFDEADIVLSKMSGDQSLLWFDYVRALTNTKQRKQKVLLTEHPETLGKVQKSLPGYKTKVDNFGDREYGYCFGDDPCNVGTLLVVPQ